MTVRNEQQIRRAEGEPPRSGRVSMADRDEAIKRGQEFRAVAGALQDAGRAGATEEEIAQKLSIRKARVVALLRDEVPGCAQRGGRWYIGRFDPALRGRRIDPASPSLGSERIEKLNNLHRQVRGLLKPGKVAR